MRQRTETDMECFGNTLDKSFDDIIFESVLPFVSWCENIYILHCSLQKTHTHTNKKKMPTFETNDKIQATRGK